MAVPLCTALGAVVGAAFGFIPIGSVGLSTRLVVGALVGAAAGVVVGATIGWLGRAEANSALSEVTRPSDEPIAAVRDEPVIDLVDETRNPPAE
jgi:hypothetical protein